MAPLKEHIFNNVKSQLKEQSETYGTSWSFQPKDKLVTNPDPNDVIFLCLVDDLNVQILNYDKANAYVDSYRDPVKDALKGHKKVIYFTDLIKKQKNI